MLYVKGVQRQTGNYEGKQYDNILLHCLNDNPANPTICGAACETIKIKTQLVSEVFGGLVNNDNDLRALMDQPIIAFYDRFSRVQKVDLIDNPHEIL